MNWPSRALAERQAFSSEPVGYRLAPPLSLRGRRADVPGGFGARALAGISSDRRMGAPRALRHDPLARVVVPIELCDDLIRRRAVLDPVRERRDNIMRGVMGRRGQSEDAADRIRSATEAAMLRI